MIGQGSGGTITAAVHYDYLLRHVSFLAACTEAEVKLLEI
jgi:hypothetical protein